MGNRIFSQTLYVLFGVVYLAAGASVLLYGATILPPIIPRIVAEVTRHDPYTLHIAQEFGTHMIVLGLVSLWFALHFDQSQVFHWAMTLGWGLFALIHWQDVRGTWDSVKGPALTTIPFVLWAVTGVLRRGGGGKQPSAKR
jgi:hypothetical protein